MGGRWARSVALCLALCVVVLSACSSSSKSSNPSQSDGDDVDVSTTLPPGWVQIVLDNGHVDAKTDLKQCTDPTTFLACMDKKFYRPAAVKKVAELERTRCMAGVKHLTIV